MMRLLAALLSALLLSTMPAVAERIHLRGSYVTIDLPEGFEESQQFTGVVWPAVRASVMVTELPTDAFQPVRDGLISDPQALADQGIVLESVDDASFGSNTGLIGRGRQQLHTQAFEKWLVLVQSQAVTLLVTAQAPALLATPARKQAIERALQSIRVVATRDDPRAALPFAFRETARFRFLRAISGSAALLTDTAFEGEPAQRPLFVVGASIGATCEQWADGVREFAEKVAGSLEQVQQLVLHETLDARLGSDRGVVTVGHGVMGGADVLVVQSLRFRDCAYIRTVGIAPASQAALYRAEFAMLAHGVSWQTAPDKP